MNDTKDKLRTALLYAEHGIHVVPVHYVDETGNCSCKNPKCSSKGKHPSIRDWPNQATIDSTKIKSWWTEQSSFNIGIVAGSKSNLVVLDIDARHNGYESLKTLEKEIGSLPNTVTAKTGGGGLHILFRHPGLPIRNAVALRNGIDVRADNGFIVAPPSNHLSGNKYEWLQGKGPGEVEIVALPKELLKILVTPPIPKISPSTLAKSKVGEGTRNDYLFKFGCSLRSKGLEEEEILAFLLSRNEKHCTPPLEEDEVAGIAERSAKYEQSAADQNENAQSQYIEKNGRIYLVARGQGAPREVPLCNFTANIAEEKVTDDGAERKTYFKIVGELSSGQNLPVIEVTSERFPSMSWVTAWGSSAIIAPGYTTKDNLRAAIQELSKDTIRSEVFSHLGWRKINDQYFFLHSGGGLGASGNSKDIKVDPSEGRLTDYLLPDPPEGEKLMEAVQASLAFLESAPDEITVPLFCGAYRAPLNEVSLIDYSLFIVGPTGVFKTSLIAIIQTHFGLSFDDRKLPDNWSSTANTLERKAFLTKDSVFTVDDFVPGVVSDREAERLFRAQGNKAGRGRMRPDGSLRPANYPRGMILSTGEDVPKGQSLRPRLFIVEVNPGDINPANLTELQRNHSLGLYTRAMSAYIRWLAPRMDKMKSELLERHRNLRTLASNSTIHKRTPDIVASLGVGLEVFLEFAVENKVLSAAESQLLFDRCWTALGQLAEKQVLYQISEDPVKRFIELLQAAFVIGRAHLVDSKTQEVPTEAKRWGWRENRFGDLTSQGERIGWMNGDEVWLQPDAAFAVVQKIANSQHSTIHVSKETLWKRLAHQGLIQVSEGEQKNLIKRSVGGLRPRVLVVKNKEILFGGVDYGSIAPVAPATVGNGSKPLGSHLERARPFFEQQNLKKDESPDGGIH